MAPLQQQRHGAQPQECGKGLGASVATRPNRNQDQRSTDRVCVRTLAGARMPRQKSAASSSREKYFSLELDAALFCLGIRAPASVRTHTRSVERWSWFRFGLVATEAPRPFPHSCGWAPCLCCCNGAIRFLKLTSNEPLSTR